MEVSTILAAAVWGIIISVLLYWYSIKRHNYFKKLSIPYVPPVPFLGSTVENFVKGLEVLEVERYKKYGRLYGFFEWFTPVFSIAEPELLRSILVKDFNFFPNRRDIKTGDVMADNMLTVLEGEDWKRVRSIVTPTFTSGKIKKMMGIFKDCTETLSQNFARAAKNETSVDLKKHFGAFTMDVIASTAFSTKIDSHNDPNNIFIHNAVNAFRPRIPWRFLLFAISSKLMRFFKIGIFPKENTMFFKNVSLQIIEERNKSKQKRNDFLQLLLDTVDESNEDKNETSRSSNSNLGNFEGENMENETIFQNTYRKKPLSMDELVAQCLIFFLAGYETTATTMTLLTYLLTINPDIQEKIMSQIDQTLRENKGELTYEAIQQMKYLDNVVSETMRLYPPVVRLERRAEEDYKLGDTGIIIPKNRFIVIPVYAIHRDAEFFPDPEKFNPDRFNTGIVPYTFMPFGSGPRNCVAMRFALTEIKVCICHLLTKFRFKPGPDTKIPIEFQNGHGLLNPKSVMIKLEVRTDNVHLG